MFVWLPIDNGFRYGRRYLFGSLAVSLLMLSIVVEKQYYWNGHVIVAAGLLLEVLLVCSYTAMPFGRLNAAHEKLAKMATRDPLTGLANRQLFIDHLQNAMALTERNGKYCACVFIDLDGFKRVNDTHGHATGDSLLMEVSKRITGSLRETDLVARLGGDEFAVTAQCFHVPVDAIMVSGRILKAVSTITEVSGIPVEISASVGVSWYQFEEGKEISVDTLIDNADKAMYAAKRAGKNRIRVVGPDGQVREPESFSTNTGTTGA
jgi:diguanylate cyclase (GGDEF)-like protein